ncbi:TLC domain-containing protein 4-B-like [Branchiostoma floridae]|uniref:TLC domain-containing protein 4-B-like n=1 Tax=Branchiostoma floridae TaxID=7739 RepID=A0A9J7HTQ6_BRAFL|nr:TLC domain-containing protein 4-B-like [Branchiostoma floridae]
MVQQSHHLLVLHHVLLIIVGFTNTFIWPFCQYFGQLMLLWEVSNIFMNLRNTLKYLGYSRSSTVFVVNEVTFVLTFFLSRIAPMPMFWYQLFYMAAPNPDFWRPEFVVGRLLYCGVLILQGMSVMWFLQILQSVKSHFKR